MQTAIVWVVLVAVIGIIVFLYLKWPPRRAEPPSREEPPGKADDGLEVSTSSPFEFESVDAQFADQLRGAINAMGGVGKDAQKTYQAAIESLRTARTRVTDAVKKELPSIPATKHLDRWALIQLLSELRDPGSLPVLDELLGSELPSPPSKPHGRNPLRQETINRTTAVEAIRRLAEDGNADALNLLLKHASNASLSVRRASIQCYLAHGGDAARDKLLEVIPKQDHGLLDIRRIDVRKAPQIVGSGYTNPRDVSRAGDAPLVPPARDPQES